MIAPHAPPTGDLASNPGLGPDWEWNRQPFGLQASTQFTEPHQPGLSLVIFRRVNSVPVYSGNKSATPPPTTIFRRGEEVTRVPRKCSLPVSVVLLVPADCVVPSSVLFPFLFEG